MIVVDAIRHRSALGVAPLDQFVVCKVETVHIGVRNPPTQRPIVMRFPVENKNEFFVCVVILIERSSAFAIMSGNQLYDCRAVEISNKFAALERKAR